MHRLLFILYFLFIPISYADHSLSQYASEMEVKYQLPQDLLVNICTLESHWRNVQGAHGEIGVCQLRPSSVKQAFPDLTRTSTSYFKYGDRGVLGIQYKLGLVGHPTQLTGVYDIGTVKVVKEFQKANNLTVDGVIGPKTWAVLFPEQMFPKATIEDKLWNPKDNIEIAAMYLARLSRVLKTNNPTIIAAAYNGGENHQLVKYMLKLEKLNND